MQWKWREVRDSACVHATDTNTNRAQVHYISYSMLKYTNFNFNFNFNCSVADVKAGPSQSGGLTEAASSVTAQLGGDDAASDESVFPSKLRLPDERSYCTGLREISFHDSKTRCAKRWCWGWLEWRAGKVCPGSSKDRPLILANASLWRPTGKLTLLAGQINVSGKVS